jgi:DNA-directed RNA polymerase specialized sigma24 family protein
MDLNRPTRCQQQRTRAGGPPPQVLRRAGQPPDDVAQDTIAQLIKRPPKREVKNPWGYLSRSASNAARDSLRALRRRQETTLDALPEQSLTALDDAIAGFIDRHATHERVVAALRIGIDMGDSLTVRIITVWLDLADELGKAPSTREVAVRAHVSHTRVAQALRQFRTLLREDP